MTCNVCEETDKALFDFPDLDLRRAHRIGVLRETIQCKHCGATMRHRFLAHALLKSVGERTGRFSASIKALSKQGLGELRVLDTDAYSPLSRLLRRCAGYSMSSYRPDREFGAMLAPQHYNVDLERMPFQDGGFDIVLTSDVMEHVRDIDSAHAEIARVLSLGGQYIFTIPFDDACETHHVLVDTAGQQDKWLVPPQYHGDPITGGILAYRVFGRGIFSDLAARGLAAEFHRVNDDAALIVDGDVFIATKR